MRLSTENVSHKKSYKMFISLIKQKQNTRLVIPYQHQIQLKQKNNPNLNS